MSLGIEIAQMAGGVLVGGYLTLKARRAGKDSVAAKESADTAAHKADAAAQNTQATSNGFAKTVLGALVRIEDAGIRTETKIDNHIETHAEADILRRRK